MISRAIADNGLPLKIQTSWTEDVYTNQDIDGNIETVDVNGIDTSKTVLDPNSDQFESVTP